MLYIPTPPIPAIISEPQKTPVQVHSTRPSAASVCAAYPTAHVSCAPQRRRAALHARKRL
eukprot:scaffold1226_cov250-Pinguiococcus_pyrenoidosus.AAC.9